MVTKVNKQEVLLAVLMSVYNDEKYLEKAIESILQQTYSNFDFYIIDDGSKDKSREIISKYAKKDSRIKIIFNEENKGLGYCLNYGVENISAKYIARMDSDDISVPTRLEKQMNYLLLNSEIDILGSFAIDIDEYGVKGKERRQPITNEEIKKLIWTNPLIHPTVIYKKSKILEIGSYRKEIIRRQDYDLWFRAVAQGLKIENMDIPLLLYRTTKDYYRKNNFKNQLYQFKIGWHGCVLTKAKPIAYVGLFIPIIKTLMPNIFKKKFDRFLNTIDPRKKQIN